MSYSPQALIKYYFELWYWGHPYEFSAQDEEEFQDLLRNRKDWHFYCTDSKDFYRVRWFVIWLKHARGHEFNIMLQQPFYGITVVLVELV